MKIIDNRGEKRIRRRSYPKNMSYKLNEKKKCWQWHDRNVKKEKEKEKVSK